MTESTLSPTPTPVTPNVAHSWRIWLSRLWQNPMTMKELRTRMRGRRAFIILTVYLALICGFMAVLYLGFALGGSNRSTETRVAGKSIFVAILSVQTFLAVFISPAFTAASITGEKERQTYDLLRTTLLSPRALISGKLLSALSYVILLILAAVPLQSVAFFLGGVSFIELFVSQLLMAVSAVAFGMVGLYVSSLMRTTVASTVTTYALVLFLLIGVPMLALFLVYFGAFFIFTTMSGTTSTSPPDWLAVVLVYVALALGSLNLPATLIASDVFLTEYDAIFYYIDTVQGYRIIIFSPWWIYFLLYSLLALFLFWAAVRQVRRVLNV